LPTDPDASNGDIVSGKPFATQPILEARNDAGIRDLHITNFPVTLSTNSSSVSLSDATSQIWDEGLATFSDLLATGNLDGEIFTLTASTQGLTSAQTSLVCDVVASIIVFTSQPGQNNSPTILHEISFATQPVLEARDQNGTRDLHTSGQVVLSVHSARLH